MAKKVFNGTAFVRFDDATTKTLLEMQEKHRLAPVDLARALTEAACQFYREHGWFSFPVVIQPEAFQARYVAEEQAAYEAAKREEKRRK